MRPDLADPADVVRWFGAVQAQDFPGSIGLRLPSTTEARVEQAIADKQIVRRWPMRGTIHCVPAEFTPLDEWLPPGRDLSGEPLYQRSRTGTSSAMARQPSRILPGG